MTPPTFLQALTQAEAQARSTLDVALHERLSAAMALVQGGRVFQTADGIWQVNSSSRDDVVYRVNGSCSCSDVHYNHPPKGLCKHRLAMYLSQRVITLMQQPSAPVVPVPVVPVPVEPDLVEPWPDNDVEPEAPAAPAETVPQPEAPVEGSHGLAPRHIVHIQGHAFVKFAGLLALAHQRGLQTLKVTWTHNSEELSLAHAIAVFPHGVFEECADSTPGNVGKKVALHWRRLSLTRAKARALRDALGCDMVALEELGGTDDV
jgi:hypothetical protein